MDRETLKENIVIAAVAKHMAQMALEAMRGPGQHRSRHRKRHYNAIAIAERNMSDAVRLLMATNHD